MYHAIEQIINFVSRHFQDWFDGYNKALQLLFEENEKNNLVAHPNSDHQGRYKNIYCKIQDKFQLMQDHWWSATAELQQHAGSHYRQ